MKTKLRKIPNGHSAVLSASNIEAAMSGVVAVFAAADGKCVLKYLDGQSEAAHCPALAEEIRNYFTGASEFAPTIFYCISTVQSAARSLATI